MSGSFTITVRFWGISFVDGFLDHHSIEENLPGMRNVEEDVSILCVELMEQLQKQAE
jgi:hypothetical protein